MTKLKLTNKEFKVVVIKMLTGLQIRMMNKMKTSTKRKYKMSHTEIIELKNIITEPENLIEISTTD